MHSLLYIFVVFCLARTCLSTPDRKCCRRPVCSSIFRASVMALLVKKEFLRDDEGLAHRFNFQAWRARIFCRSLFP